MHRTAEASALEVLVVAELDALLAAESGLVQRFAVLRSDRAESDEHIEFLGDLANADELAGRLERLLEAMSYCGYDAPGAELPKRDGPERAPSLKPNLISKQYRRRLQ